MNNMNILDAWNQFQSEREHFRELFTQALRNGAKPRTKRSVSVPDQRAYAAAVMTVQTDEEALAHISKDLAMAKAFMKEVDEKHGVSPTVASSGNDNYFPPVAERPFFRLGAFSGWATIASRDLKHMRGYGTPGVGPGGEVKA
jgi:hypothetical protein